jgi:hypothetical protein
MSRGNGQQDVLLGDADRQDFIKTLAEAGEKPASDNQRKRSKMSPN